MVARLSVSDVGQRATRRSAGRGYALHKREPGANPGLPRSGEQERTSRHALGPGPGKQRSV